MFHSRVSSAVKGFSSQWSRIRCFSGIPRYNVFKKNLFLSWALYCCISPCCMEKWISCVCTHTPSLLGLFPSRPAQPSRPSQSPSWAPVLGSSSPLEICLTHSAVYMSVLLSVHPAFSFQDVVLSWRRSTWNFSLPWNLQNVPPMSWFTEPEHTHFTLSLWCLKVLTPRGQCTE